MSHTKPAGLEPPLQKEELVQRKPSVPLARLARKRGAMNKEASEAKSTPSRKYHERVSKVMLSVLEGDSERQEIGLRSTPPRLSGPLCRNMHEIGWNGSAKDARLFAEEGERLALRWRKSKDDVWLRLLCHLAQLIAWRSKKKGAGRERFL